MLTGADRAGYYLQQVFSPKCLSVRIPNGVTSVGFLKSFFSFLIVFFLYFLVFFFSPFFLLTYTGCTFFVLSSAPWLIYTKGKHCENFINLQSVLTWNTIPSLFLGRFSVHWASLAISPIWGSDSPTHLQQQRMRGRIYNTHLTVVTKCVSTVSAHDLYRFF